jgi:hypothetical protein
MGGKILYSSECANYDSGGLAASRVLDDVISTMECSGILNQSGAVRRLGSKTFDNGPE